MSDETKRREPRRWGSYDNSSGGYVDVVPAEDYDALARECDRLRAKLERVRALTALQPHNQSRPSMVLTAHIDAALADEEPSDGE